MSVPPTRPSPGRALRQASGAAPGNASGSLPPSAAVRPTPPIATSTLVLDKKRLVIDLIPIKKQSFEGQCYWQAIWNS